MAHTSLLGVSIVLLGGCCLDVISGNTGPAGPAANSSTGRTTVSLGGSSSGGSSSGGGASTGSSSSAVSSTGTNPGTTTGSAFGCTIDGQQYYAYQADPSNGAACCNPTLSNRAWVPMFVKVFEFPVASQEFTGPSDGLATDLNGDGVADIVLTTTPDAGNDALSQIWVYLSVDGGYSGPWTYLQTSSAPSWLTVADLNRDGLPDVVFSGQSGIEVRESAADGQLGGSYSIAAPCGGGPVKVLDVNGDGWSDVIEENSCDIFLFRNDGMGDGHLTWDPNPIVGSLWANEIAVGAFNDDGIGDLAYVNRDGGVSWLEGTGRDLDGDGGGELFPVPDSGATIAHLTTVTDPHDELLITGAPDFVVGCDTRSGPYSCGDQSSDFGIPNAEVAVGRFYEDDLPDGLIVGDLGDGGSWVLAVDSRSFAVGATPTPQAIPGPQPIQRMAVGDLNGDGFTDLVIFRQGGGWEGWVNTCGPGPVVPTSN